MGGGGGELGRGWLWLGLWIHNFNIMLAKIASIQQYQLLIQHISSNGYHWPSSACECSCSGGGDLFLHTSTNNGNSRMLYMYLWWLCHVRSSSSPSGQVEENIKSRWVGFFFSYKTLKGVCALDLHELSSACGFWHKIWILCFIPNLSTVEENLAFSPRGNYKHLTHLR